MVLEDLDWGILHWSDARHCIGNKNQGLGSDLI